MEKVIFEHQENKYKLSLAVEQVFNDYRENCAAATLKLYTFDNLLVETENYIFPVKWGRFKSISLAFDFFLDHLQERHLPLNLAYDLYVKALNNGSEITKKL